MDLKSVLDLLKAVEKTGMNKFELQDGDFSVRMERGTGETTKTVYVTAPPQISAQIGTAPAAPAPAASPAPAEEAAQASFLLQQKARERIFPPRSSEYSTAFPKERLSK